VAHDSNGLGRAIAAAREERGWKRKDLVDRADISYPFLAEVENGHKQPSMAKLNEIAEALGMTAAALLARAGLIEEQFGSRVDAAWPSQVPVVGGVTGLAATALGKGESRDEVQQLVQAVMRELEPRLRDLVELEVRRALERQRGSAW
jgi:transcriptional regulator with XRE-family HTH domain